MSQVLLWRWGWAEGAFDKTSTAQTKRSSAPEPLGWRPEPVLSQSWQSCGLLLVLGKIKWVSWQPVKNPSVKVLKLTMKRNTFACSGYYFSDGVYLDAPTSLPFTTFHILNRGCTCFHWFWTCCHNIATESRDDYTFIYWCTIRSFHTTCSFSTFKHGTDSLWDPDVLQEGQLTAQRLEAGPKGAGRPRGLSSRTNCDPVGDNPARWNTEKTPADKQSFSPCGAFTCTDISVD